MSVNNNCSSDNYILKIQDFKVIFEDDRAKNACKMCQFEDLKLEKVADTAIKVIFKQKNNKDQARIWSWWFSKEEPSIQSFRALFENEKDLTKKKITEIKFENEKIIKEIWLQYDKKVNNEVFL